MCPLSAVLSRIVYCIHTSYSFNAFTHMAFVINERSSRTIKLLKAKYVEINNGDCVSFQSISKGVKVFSRVF